MAVQTNASVVRAFQILNLFLEGKTEITAATVSDALGMNAVTAHRFLKTLESTGALAPVSRGSYRLGYALADLGNHAMRSEQLVSVMQPVLESLAGHWREGALASTFDGEMVQCIARAAPDRPLYVDIRPGTRLEAWCTAHGKLWLAAMEPAKLESYIAKHVPDDRRAGLLEELAGLPEEGVSFNRREREPDINAVAVPVTARDGRMICGLSIYGPANRLSEEVMKGFIPDLKAAARMVAQQLYGTDVA